MAKKHTNKGRKYNDWKPIVAESKDIILASFNKGVPLTVRAVFYRLVSTEVLKNTVGVYVALGTHLRDARKAGLIPWEAIVDNTRHDIGAFSDFYLTEAMLEEMKEELMERCEDGNLDTVIEAYFDEAEYTLELPYKSNWAGMPVIPEIWIEKDAIAGPIEAMTKQLPVRIRVHRGYSSWSYFQKCAVEMKQILSRHERIHVLYIGDLDPTGVNMDVKHLEKLEFFGLSNKVDFERIALTDEQFEKYNLPETMGKTGDTRNNGYTKKHKAECDALLAMAPEAFEDLVRTSVKKYYHIKKSTEVSEENERIAGISESNRFEAINILKEKLTNENTTH